MWSGGGLLNVEKRSLTASLRYILLAKTIHRDDAHSMWKSTQGLAMGGCGCLGPLLETSHNRCVYTDCLCNSKIVSLLCASFSSRPLIYTASSSQRASKADVTILPHTRKLRFYK